MRCPSPPIHVADSVLHIFCVLKAGGVLRVRFPRPPVCLLHLRNGVDIKTNIWHAGTCLANHALDHLRSPASAKHELAKTMGNLLCSEIAFHYPSIRSQHLEFRKKYK